MQGTRLRFPQVARLIGRYGLVLACAGVPYALLAAFLGLWFTELHWPGKEAALAAFGGGYVFMRLFFADLPARLGAVRVAIASIAVALAGQMLVAFAPAPLVAIAGALISGLGFSLIYPALGVQLVRITPPASRGAVIGGFSAFFDIAIGVSGPVGGLIAAQAGYQTVFVAAALAQIAALLLLATAGEPRHDG
jgi:MFS family permease